MRAVLAHRGPAKDKDFGCEQRRIAGQIGINAPPEMRPVKQDRLLRDIVEPRAITERERGGLDGRKIIAAVDLFCRLRGDGNVCFCRAGQGNLQSIAARNAARTVHDHAFAAVREARHAQPQAARFVVTGNVGAPPCIKRKISAQHTLRAHEIGKVLQRCGCRLKARHTGSLDRNAGAHLISIHRLARA